MSNWYFNKRRPYDRARNPENEAHFTTDTLPNVSEALVREGIQNAIDAHMPIATGERRVSVRIKLVNKPTSSQRKFMADLFRKNKAHFTAGLGNPNLANLLDSESGFLVFEDFGTKGLVGDINESRLEHVKDNAFFSFFRAEGMSPKDGEKLGRWGIGKQVFISASQVRAMFGLTVRSDSPKRVLMGSAVVRMHTLQGQDFEPDAWYGTRGSEESMVLPLVEAAAIDSFATTFQLRRTSEPGLSIVVPFVDSRIGYEDLKRAIIRSYFWPIINGELSVDLESDDEFVGIQCATLKEFDHLLPTAEAKAVEFARWAVKQGQSETIILSGPRPSRLDWESYAEAYLTESTLQSIRAKLDKEQRVGIRIPVHVRPKDASVPRSDSYFTVYIETCTDEGHRPIFLRDGIAITEVQSPGGSGTRSLVVVEDRPLAGLLGDSEGVNHTQWQKNSPKFHKKYIGGAEIIKLVSRSVHEILLRLYESDRKGDPSLLLFLFSLPKEDGQRTQRSTPDPASKGNSSAPPGGAKTRPRKFDIRQTSDGFAMRPSDAELSDFPVPVVIRAGYAVRKGNPINRWQPDDFSFGNPPLSFEPEPSGVEVVSAAGNTIRLNILQSDFTFGVKGFDTNRDLVVSALETRQSNEADV